MVELLVVLMLVAVGSSLVVLGWRDAPANPLSSEADRLVQVLETARALARSQQTPMLWRSDTNGFSVQPMARLSDHTSAPAQKLPNGETFQHLQWLTPGTQSDPQQLVFSAEPVQAPMRLQLTNSNNGVDQLTLISDGVTPWQRQP